MESLSVQVLRRLPVGGADGPHGAARIGATFPVRAFLCFPTLGAARFRSRQAAPPLRFGLPSPLRRAAPAYSPSPPERQVLPL